MHTRDTRKTLQSSVLFLESPWSALVCAGFMIPVPGRKYSNSNDSSDANGDPHQGGYSIRHGVCFAEYDWICTKVQKVNDVLVEDEEVGEENEWF